MTSKQQQAIAAGPSSGPYSWSMVGNPTINLHGHNQEFGAPGTLDPAGAAAPGSGGAGGSGGGGGLLQHPVPLPQAPPYNIYLPYPPPPPVSTSPGQNYVGVIGGGRPGGAHHCQLSAATSRQRSLHRAGPMYAPPPPPPQQNLTYSPSGPSAAAAHQFQLHSDFYSALSPSHHPHQRVPMQTFALSQNRAGLSNPATTGLYAAAAFGVSSNQATPPPIPSQVSPIEVFHIAIP